MVIFVLINTSANGKIFRVKKLQISLRSVFDTLYMGEVIGLIGTMKVGWYPVIIVNIFKGQDD